MKKSFLTITVLLIVAILCIAGCSQPAPAPTPKPTPTPAPAPAPAKLTVLKAVYGTPSAKGEITQNYIAEVNKRGEGLVKIDVVGGTEVIPPFNQGEALRSGAMDMNIYLPPEYAETIMPSALCMGISTADFAEERAIGAYDYWVELFKKYLNARYLGRNDGYLQAQVFLRKPITTLADFKGLIIRVSAMYEPMVKGLGASPTILPLPEVYSALEKGVIDGLITMERGPFDFKLQPVAKYMILPRFFQGSSAILVNNDVWDKLPKQAQDILLNTLLEQQPKMLDLLKAERTAKLDNYYKAGMKDIEFVKDEAKQFLDIAYGSTWDYVMKKAPAETAKFKEFESKLKR